MQVKFYIKRESDADYTDLESYFNGMRYMKCEGLEDLGKPKNVYIETYADADMIRVSQPTQITREATKITFTFGFFGDEVTRQSTYDQFNRFIENQKLYFYDTMRRRRAYMIMLDKTEPKEDVYKGQGYMTAEYTFQNMKGYCDRISPNSPDINTLAISASSDSVMVGKSIRFYVKLNGEDIQGARIFVDDKFVDTGEAGYYIYAPQLSGVYRVYARYTFPDEPILDDIQSNTISFTAYLQSNDNEPEQS